LDHLRRGPAVLLELLIAHRGYPLADGFEIDIVARELVHPSRIDLPGQYGQQRKWDHRELNRLTLELTISLVPCPKDPEETAEAYCKGKLSDAEADAFEAHCSECRKCARALSDEALIVGMMRAVRARRSQRHPKSGELNCR
jgi:hypothetical protein